MSTHEYTLIEHSNNPTCTKGILHTKHTICLSLYFNDKIY